jgi:cell division protein FtsZ
MGEMGKAMMGTGEGEGPNRALEAAERAIANPLLDGVSMQGAKGVIISIIGGDDMKLLEVDEAANHIRELVDPNANIIWGSAFNPDLAGKIRVSVVATGIEQSAEQAEIAARPLSFAASRGPVLPTAAAAAVAAPAAEPLFSPPETVIEPEPEPEPEASPLELLDEAVEIEDPIADEWSDEDETTVAEKNESSGGPAGGYASLTEVSSGRREPLDLGLEQVDDDEPGDTRQDDLLLDASRLAAEDGPVSPIGGRRRSLVSEGGFGGGGGAGGGGGGVPGNTLFERMANLSRGVKSSAEPEEEEEDDGASISIPRFLGRQNNQ